eukprot:1158420-Pelagomonas_calceolata.AAC.9
MSIVTRCKLQAATINRLALAWLWSPPQLVHANSSDGLYKTMRDHVYRVVAATIDRRALTELTNANNMNGLPGLTMDAAFQVQKRQQQLKIGRASCACMSMLVAAAS